MGEHHVSTAPSEQQLRQFTTALLADVRALESMLDDGKIESGIRRIGAEQELFLVDRDGRPSLVATKLLERLGDPRFTTELALFNLEANLSPQVFGGSCLKALETELRELLLRARDTMEAEFEGGGIVLTGILPTLRKSDLGLSSMTPNPRYRMLNDAIMAQRANEPFHFRIKGADDIDTTHDNVMLESANTSFQIHFQVGPDEFAQLYNLAQAITAPVLACAVNSPLLLGRRLWRETRVALFQQSVDSRSQQHQARGLRPRVMFGDDWIDSSVLEVFREDIARFRVMLATEVDEDPQQVLARGDVPAMTALRLHNGTVYRWNRACYGVQDGIAHLRIENRVLPAGPTVIDEIANAALYFGLMSALAEEYGDITKVMAFDDAQHNFVSAARDGLRAQFAWLGREYPAATLILDHLIPLARQGLAAAKLDAGDVDRYLGVVEDRVRAGVTGATWLINSLQGMSDAGTPDQRLRSLTRATMARQRQGEPVHTWTTAELSESEDHASYLKVGQFMTTDLFTVRAEDVVDLAASLMDWRHIRHLPVEDHEGRLVGLVSHRALLRLVGKGIRSADERNDTVSVKDIMRADPVTASPDTATLDAIELMRAHKVGCLPIVEGDKLVGIVTERDLINVAGKLFETYLRKHTVE